jgi:hypothetical protein
LKNSALRGRDDGSEDVLSTDVPRVVLTGPWGTSHQVKQVSKNAEYCHTTGQLCRSHQNGHYYNISPQGPTIRPHCMVTPHGHTTESHHRIPHMVTPYGHTRGSLHSVIPPRSHYRVTPQSHYTWSHHAVTLQCNTTGSHRLATPKCYTTE